MRAGAAARRYARALFGLADESGSVEAVRRDLAALAGLFEETPELRNAILRPLHPGAQRRAVLRSICRRAGADPVVERFLCFLVDQRRVIEFAAIRSAYEALADAAAGRTRAQVVSAGPLRDDQQARLRGALEARTGKQVELELRVDPALLGGVVASVGGLVFDGSLRTQLRQLRTSLTRGH